MRVLEGAKLTIAAGGDGISAGADVYLAGGETSLWCAGRSGAPLNAAGGEVFADGGTLIAAGGGDNAAIAEDSAQNVLRARFNGTLREGARVVVENESGEAVFSFAPENDFSRLLTSPALAQGETYTLYVEGEALGMATVDGAETYFRGDFTEERDERNRRDEPREDDGRDAQPPMENGAERIRRKRRAPRLPRQAREAGRFTRVVHLAGNAQNAPSLPDGAFQCVDKSDALSARGAGSQALDFQKSPLHEEDRPIKKADGRRQRYRERAWSAGRAILLTF